MQKKEVKSTSEQLEAVLGRLTSDQIRFVVARQEFSTDKDAAEAIEIKPNTVSKWKADYPIDDAVRLMAMDGIIVAKELRRRNLAKAMAVKVAGLDSGKEQTRQNVATEIIEWEMGRATQKVESKGEVKNEVIVSYVDDWRATNQATVPASGPDSGQE